MTTDEPNEAAAPGPVSIRRILCPTDFSKTADHALDVARQLASELGAAIELVHVFETPLYAWPDLPIAAQIGGHDGQDLIALFQKTARTDLDSRLEELRELGVTCDAHIVQRGALHESINSAADQMDADLLVVGTHGRSGVTRLVVGSVAERVVRTSRRPVLVVPPREDAATPPTGRCVLCPVDFSAPSDHALAYAVGVAARLELPLHVVYVNRIPDALIERREFIAYLAGEGRKDLKELTEQYARRGVELHAHFVEGEPHQGIAKTAAAQGATMVVMGTHGRSGVTRLLLGSVADRVIRSSSIPVLVVPSPADEG